MSYEDLSGGISEHEAGEEFMQQEDERRRDEQMATAEATLRSLLERRGGDWFCHGVSDWLGWDVSRPESGDEAVLWEALENVSYYPFSEPDDVAAKVFRLVGKWAQEQQKAKGSAA